MVAMKAKSTNGVISAAKASLVSFNKHIAVNERCYEFRRRYHISTKPEGPNTPESGLYTPNFFGCSADEFHIDAVLEWVQYKKEWEKREAEDPEWFKKVDNYKFWDSFRASWPHISYFATWWSDWPTSSVAAERVFALARVVDHPQRGALSWKSFAIELFIKSNRLVLDDMLTEEYNKVDSMTKRA